MKANRILTLAATCFALGVVGCTEPKVEVPADKKAALDSVIGGDFKNQTKGAEAKMKQPGK